MALPSNDHLALLYRLSQAFNSSLELDAVLNRVMDEVIAAVRAERGFVMLRDAAGELVFRVARGMDQQALTAPQFQVSRGVVERVARTGQPVLTSDAQADQQLNLRESVLALGLRSVLCVPLALKTEVLGVVYVDNRLHAGLFQPADLELLTAIAASAAVALENARLYQLAVDRGRLEREAQMAREVQARLLPRATPQLAGWEFAAYWLPAREVAGDYFDFIPAGPDRLGLVIGDVTDKGMPAALFMALTRSTVRASLATAVSPADGLAQANRLIAADSADSMFVTLAYVEVGANSNEVVAVCAGHTPVLIYQAGPASFRQIRRTGLPLGVDAVAAFGQVVERLAPGDLLLLYTDGVTEARNRAGEEFGLTRLEAVLRANAAAPVEAALAAVRQALEAFDEGEPQLDDLTLVLARRTPAPTANRPEAAAVVTRWPEAAAPTSRAIRERLAAEQLAYYGWTNAPGDVYAPHTHAYHKVVYVVEGAITFHLPETGAALALGPGDRLDLPPGVLHEAVVGPAGVSCIEARRA